MHSETLRRLHADHLVSTTGFLGAEVRVPSRSVVPAKMASKAWVLIVAAATTLFRTIINVTGSVTNPKMVWQLSTATSPKEVDNI